MSFRLNPPHGPRSIAPVLAISLALLAGCSKSSDVRGGGTIEMDEVDVASMTGGRVGRILVDEGDAVQVGDTLAVLDRGEVIAALAAQAARTQSAVSQARDMEAGSRPEEVLTAQAELSAAQAAQRLAQANFDRAQSLHDAKAVSDQDLDRARADRDAANARVKSASETLRLRETGFRRQQVAAAKQAAEAAEAQLRGARSTVGELTLVAPISGVVLLRNFEPGEIVSPGAAVVTLGNPDSLWMRVYVAAPEMTRFRLGAPVDVRPIGAKRDFPGRVIEIASQAEFTPRAALTEQEQANLVFGVKVALSPSDGALKAGLPAEAHIHSEK